MNKFEKFFNDRNPGHLSELRSFVNSGIQTPNIPVTEKMNVAIMDVFSRLLMDRSIYFASEVSDLSCSIVNAQLLYLASEDPEDKITMYIDSPGGSCSSGFGLVETIGYIPCPVETINMGMAASMGSLLLMAGNKGLRKSLPGSRVLIHQPRIIGGGGGVTTADELEIEANEIMKTKKLLFEFIALRTGKTYEEVAERAKNDQWLSAQEALDYGCIDEIIKIDWSKK